MKKSAFSKVSFLLIYVFILKFSFAQQFEFKENFSNPSTLINTIGRGNCKIVDSVFKSKDAYASFGKLEWKNYSIQFRARAPQNADQVQIWAGFRAFNRNDRYVVGLRGGLQNSLYLSRMGYMGTDEFLDLNNLDFEPKPGIWYDIKMEVCGERIRIFLNNKTLPRIDVIDKNAKQAPYGEITLGGSWIETEFDDLQITSLNENYFNNNKSEVPTVCEIAFKVNRDAQVVELANQTKIHGYINGDMLTRSDYVKTIKGFPIIRINKGG